MDEWEVQSLIYQRGNVLRRIKSEEQRKCQRERYERLKTLQPSPGRVISQGGKPYRNPLKAEKRAMVKLYGRRQYLKKMKAYRCIVSEVQVINNYETEGLR